MEPQEFNAKDILNQAARDVSSQEELLSESVALAAKCINPDNEYIVVASEKCRVDTDRSVIKFSSNASMFFYATVVESILEEVSDRNILIHIHKCVRERIRSIDAAEQTG